MLQKRFAFVSFSCQRRQRNLPRSLLSNCRLSVDLAILYSARPTHLWGIEAEVLALAGQEVHERVPFLESDKGRVRKAKRSHSPISPSLSPAAHCVQHRAYHEVGHGCKLWRLLQHIDALAFPLRHKPIVLKLVQLRQSKARQHGGKDR